MGLTNTKPLRITSISARGEGDDVSGTMLPISPFANRTDSLSALAIMHANADFALVSRYCIEHICHWNFTHQVQL